MQRLGHIKALMLISSRSKVNDLQALTYSLSNLILNKVFVNLNTNKELKEYICNRRLYGKGRKYSYLEHKNGDVFSKDYDISNLKIEIQDCYLSDSNLPSNTGSVSEGSITEIIDWCTSLGFLERQKYIQTTLGKLLHRINTFNGSNTFREFSDENPYLLNLKEKILFLWSYVKYDGDILYPFLNNIYHKYNFDSFKREDVGENLLHAYENSLNIYKRKARRSYELNRLKQIDNVINSITSQIEKKKFGNKNLGTAELRSTARLEPLIDMGILLKHNTYSYTYNCSNASISFLKYADYDIDSLLKNHFFSMVNEIYELKCKKLEDEEEILKNIINGYYIMRNPLGLSSIEESIILGNIDLINSNKKYFEIYEAKKILINYSKKYSKEIRLHVDGLGNIKFFIINNNLLKMYEII